MTPPTAELISIASRAAISTIAQARGPRLCEMFCSILLPPRPPGGRSAGGLAFLSAAGYRRDRKSRTLWSKRKVSKIPAIWPRSLSMG